MNTTIYSFSGFDSKLRRLPGLILCSLFFLFSAGYTQVKVTSITTSTTDTVDVVRTPVVNGSTNYTITYNGTQTKVTQFIAGGTTYSVIQGTPGNVQVRRNTAGGINQVTLWNHIQSMSGTSHTVYGRYYNTFESAFTAMDIKSGTENLFVNVWTGSNPVSNVERMDYIFNSAFNARATIGFAVFERGGNGQGTTGTFKIAAITGFDGNGRPTYSGSNFIQVQASVYTDGTLGGSTNYDTFTKKSTGTDLDTIYNVNIGPQGLSGAFISTTSLLPAGTPIYGYSIFGVDVTTTNVANLVDWTNSTYFPTTSGSGNDMDMVTSGAMAFSSGLEISGNVYDDANGLIGTPANTVDGTGTNAGGLYAILVNNSTGLVVENISVTITGGFVFTGAISGTSYSIRISTLAGIVGNSPPIVVLPSNWVNTGENLGAGAGSDGTVNGILTVVVGATDVTNANFGIEQLPSGADYTASAQCNPGGTTQVSAPSAVFTGTDPEDGTYPAGLSGRKVTLYPATNGSLYYNGTLVSSSTTITSFNPSLVTVDPNNGTISMTFNYAVWDNADKVDPVPNTITLPFIQCADLSITKTDGKTYYGTGLNTYTIVVTNSGPEGVTGAVVTDVKPQMATSMSWQVTNLTGGATVNNMSGSGSINELVNMPAGSTITYSVTLMIPCGATGVLSNTASVDPPAGITDNNTFNNSQTDENYESVWTGDIDSNWDNPGNWTQGEPACDKNAIIPNVSPKPNPVISSTGNFADNLTIQQGAQLTINPGMDLKVCGCTQINDICALYLKADSANGNSSFVTTQAGTISYANNGTACVELYLTACDNNDIGCWHYVSSPVADARVGVFDGDYMKSFNEVTGTWSEYYTHSDTPMNVLQGYIVYNPTAGVRTFRGQLNDGTYQQTLTRTLSSLSPGWNLVGNPYASEIDLNTTMDWTDVDQVVYYYNQTGGNYLAYLVNPYGFGLGSRYVPSMQGFFVHVYDGGAPDYNNTSGIIRFTDDNRTTTGDVTFYKDLPSDALKLKVQGSTNLYDETLLYFSEGLTGSFERNFDAMKFAGPAGSPQLYTVSVDDANLTIDGRSYEGINSAVPVGFYVNAPVTGEYTIRAENLGSFRPGTTITLEDKKLNSSQDLMANPAYNFIYTDGDEPSRFLLHFYNPFFGVEDKEISRDLQIYSFGKDVYLKDLTGDPQKGEFFLYNQMGQEIAHKPVSAIQINKYTLDVTRGYYMVRVITKDNSYNAKVFIE